LIQIQGFCEFSNEPEGRTLSRFKSLCTQEDQLRTKTPLSGREQQCLLWVSHGKTSWETSVILGLSERTVNFHLLNACRKLNVYGRQAGVAKAMRLGWLSGLSTAPDCDTDPSAALTSVPATA
jgi:DNA-binding CsgD family transcriptional regulator